ncbi:hypothetical protein D3C87_2006640 [compost metagenome]
MRTVLVSGSRESLMKPCNSPIAPSARFKMLSAVASRLVTLDCSAIMTAVVPLFSALVRIFSSLALPPDNSI